MSPSHRLPEGAAQTALTLDLTRNVFQINTANATDVPAFRKKLRQDQVLAFLGTQPICLVTMETYPGAHH